MGSFWSSVKAYLGWGPVKYHDAPLHGDEAEDGKQLAGYDDDDFGLG